MGIVVFPVLFAAFAVGVFSIIRFVMLVKAKKVSFPEAIFGVASSIALITLALLYYSFKDQMNGTQYALNLPVLFIIAPFVGHFILANHTNSKKQFLSKILLVSAFISFTIMICFFNTFLELPEFLGVKATH